MTATPFARTWHRVLSHAPGQTSQREKCNVAVIGHHRLRISLSEG